MEDCGAARRRAPRRDAYGVNCYDQVVVFQPYYGFVARWQRRSCQPNFQQG
jgi:hypothetical protein